MLEQDNFLVNRLRIVKEVEVRDKVCDALRRLPVAVGNWLLLWTLNIVKVEQVRVQDDLRTIIEKHSVASVGQHVAEAVLRAEIHKLDDKFGAKLTLRRRHQKCMIDSQCACWLDLG